jgi:tetratricopeptide (TPR) repeat protein
VFPAVLAPHTLAFDRFRIEREAGRGGMGAVYLAHDLVRDERVALKVLLSEAEGIDRFVRESQTLASLGHPGIVRYIDHGRAPFGPAWLAMEWLEGESLSERLRRGPIGVEEAVRIARDAAEALGAAHAAGVVHRDIKPGNIFLARAGEGAPRVKVLDFGIARASKADLRSLTTTGTVLGTPYYMAPEQARSLRGIDARADVWSLGAVLYEMLGQRRPFEHESVVAVLAAVLLEEPPPLRELCPEAGESLTELVTRCLTKDPDGRPAHGAELVTLLDALDASQRTTLPLGGFPLGGARASRGLTEREQRVVFLVLALHAASGSDATVSDAGWSQSAAAQSPEGALRSIAEAHGARVESLTDGALVAILPDQGAPADQAARAARLALAMHQAVPPAALVVGAGRAEVGLRLPVGDVVQRASELAMHARADAENAVRLDEVAASFLGTRFVLVRDGSGVRLLGVAPETDTGSKERRAFPLIGREREVRALLDLAHEAHTEPVARVAVVVGAPGIGKSRLLSELDHRLREEGGTVYALRGEPLRATSPHALAALLVRAAAGIEEGEALGARREKLAALVRASVAPEDVTRTTMFLGEIARVPMADDEADAALRAARGDAFLRGDLVARAFSTWLAGACQKTPTSILIDDLPFVDEASIALFDRALKAAPDAPLFLVVASRAIDAGAPVLPEHEPTHVRLAKLSTKASRALMDAIAPGTSPELADRIIERAEGNPLFLEEMGRAARRGDKIESLPTSVLAVVEDRITELEPGARRVLRALSILGTHARRAELSVLLGGSDGGALDDWLGLLERRDLLVRSRGESREAEPSWTFRQPLVREAAYAMLTAEDRRLGHHLAAELALASPDADPGLVAEHFDRAGEGERAAQFYGEAADRSLGAHDLKGSLARATRGLALATSVEVRARLSSIKSVAHRWRGEYVEAFEEAQRALAGEAEGSAGWLAAASTYLSAASQLGRGSEAGPLIATLLELAPEDPTRTGLIVTLCRAGSALLGRGDPSASRVALGRAESLLGEVPEPLPLAWCQVLRASHALAQGDVGAFALGTELAVASYERAGDARDAVNQRVRLGNAWTSLGVPERAEPVLRAALADATRMELKLIEGYALQNLGHALDWLGRRGEARDVLSQALAVAEALKDARLEAGVRLYVAELERGAGETERAEREARRASELVRSIPGFGAVAAAHHALALLSLGRLDAARAEASFANEALEANPGAFEEGEVTIRRARIEVLAAEGRADEARAASATAWARIEQRAARIGDEALRESFRRQVPDHARIRELMGAA